MGGDDSSPDDVPERSVTAFAVTLIADMGWSHQVLAAASAPPAGGAPPSQVIGATAAGAALTLGLVLVGWLHRSGRMRLLDILAEPFAWLLRVPRWAALPAALATGAVLLAGIGFYWDVAVHIDKGRDPGPFGTAAHYPILLGLFGIFAAGWLAVVMARGDEAARAGIRLGPDWVAPTSGVVMLLSGGFALLGFPLDDLWHAAFGQDVTLWGPTHLILLTGGQLVIVTILGLLAEGRAAMAGAKRGPGSPRRRWITRTAVAVSGSGGILLGLSVYQAEFAFGVPQYRLLFQPVLLAFSAALALVMARALVGRGGALAATGFYLLFSAGFTLLVGPVFGRVAPEFPTYLGAAVAVELAAFLVSPRRIRSFALVSGALVGTIGTLAEWGWTHVWMPIPWPAHFVPSAIALAVPAGVCGALIGAFVAGSLAPRRVERPGRRPWLPAAAGLVGLAAILAALVPTTVTPGSAATVALREVQGGAQRSVEATVTVRPASLADRAEVVQELAWQGHAPRVQAQLRRIAPGVYRTVKPLPVHGTWKALIRVQHGSFMGDVPIYLPADPAIPAPGISAPAQFQRAFISDHKLMQRERKRDAPGWLWSVAIAGVLVLIAVLLVIIGWGLNRIARLPGTPPPARKQPAAPLGREHAGAAA
jgi:hypothetical protein